MYISEDQMFVSTEGLVNLLRSNLTDRYKDIFCIVQELLQNADDAGASRVHFGVSEGLGVNHPLGRLPALLVINDGRVSQSNISAIRSVASGDKVSEKGKIGKFGLGMKSVFHVSEGFFIFGDGEGVDLPTPRLCTPWSEEYHQDWFAGLDAAKRAMDQAVRSRIKDIVAGWDRWFCVWLPLRSESMHAGHQTKPIIQTYPSDADLDNFAGSDNASRAAHMLPLLRHVEHLSFSDRHGVLRKYSLEGASRMSGGTGRFSGSVQVEGPGLAPFHYSGVENKIDDGMFSHLKSLRCWPENTRFVPGEGLQSFPDKTDSHVAVCIISESSDSPSLTVSPCVYLPLSDVRENAKEYTKFKIGGKKTVTIDLHGNLFVDAGRREFSIHESLGRDPVNETELREEWNLRMYENGILPQIVPELHSVLQKWDEETANAVMRAIREVPFFQRWIASACRNEGIALELKADGYKWSRISSRDAVFKIDLPRSPIVRRVVVEALPNDAHVIDASAGALLRPGIEKSEFTPEICQLMLRGIAALDPKDSDNELLRKFAQTCAAKLDFSSLDSALRSAVIWKAGDGRYSYDELCALLKKHRLYCHAEGDLRKIFLSAVECSPIQVNEPLARALGLDIPDFTYDFVLDILQDGPKLRSADSRRLLLERLLHIPHESFASKWVKACRYLVHGETRLLECSDPIFMPVDGEYHEFSEKIVDVLSRRKYGAPCKVPRTITDILDRPRQSELNLPLSTAEELVCALAKVGDLSNEGFLENDWRQLVMMVQNPFEQPNVENALRRIPIYPTESGQFAALTDLSFYEGDYSIAPQLRPFIRILKIDGDERLMGRMRRLANKWNPNACIKTANRCLTDATDFASIVVDALNVAEHIDISVEDILRKKEWVRMTDGRFLSPMSILKLPYVSGMVPGCDTISEVADSSAAKAISKHGLFLGLQSSVERLVEAMANVPDGRFALGEFKDDAGEQIHIEIEDLFNVLPESIDETLPAMGVLRRLRNNRVAFKEYVPKLMSRLPAEAMVSVLSVLTDRIEDDNIDTASCWNFLVPYLNEAARRSDFITSIMPRLRFRNRNGSLKKPGDLCVGVSGVPDRFILDDEYLRAKDFLHRIETTARSRKSEEQEKQTTLREYFAGWPTEFDDRIGGFIVCCTDQSDELELVKSRYGFGSRNIAESRNSIVSALNTYLANQHCYILATPDEQINVVAINGDVMSVSVTPLAGASDLFCGQFNTCELVGNRALWYMGNPPKPDEAKSLILRLRKLDLEVSSALSPKKLDELLANTLSSIIQVYGFTGSNVEAYWESLKNIEQLDVRVTKSVILQSLDMYLPQIRCKNEKLKETFKKSSQLQYGEEQARLNGDRQQETAYREERMELHRQLETMITQDVGLQDSILDALRDRVRGFSYNIDSILFELFQNADDACEEMCQLCGGVAINMPNRFDVRFDGRNLIVAHWGRPINQAKIGSEANPKFDEYRVDLQKMILLSQSGKEIDGVQTKGLYGLGFKSVFLVCDTPCVLSGKLRFKIIGGLLPEPLEEEEDSRVREFAREFEDVPSDVKPTVFILPLRKDVRDEVANAVQHFAHEIGVLGLFSRRIRKIIVRESNNSVTAVDLSGDANALHDVRTCGVNDSYFRIDTEEATLLTAAKDGRPMPLAPDVATYWATCPTSVKAGLGVAINANLKLDTGRQALDAKSAKNKELFVRAATALHTRLSGWIESIPASSRYDALNDLFFTFTGGNAIANWDSSHGDANAMTEVLWGSRGAYRRILEEHAAIPSGLDGRYRALCYLRDIKWVADRDVMASGLIDEVNTCRLRPGDVVSGERFLKVGNVFFPEMMRGINPYDSVMLLSDLAKQSVRLGPEWCNAHAERLYALVKPQIERQEVREVVRRFEFESLEGAGCKPTKLLIAEDEEERLRSKFLPGGNVLAGAYGCEARKLVKLFRCGDGMDARELANFALNAATNEQREAVLLYLTEGEPSAAFKEALRDGKHSSWLNNWQEHCRTASFGLKETTKIIVELSRDDAEFEGQIPTYFGSRLNPEPGPSLEGPEQMPSLLDVHRWWAENSSCWIEKYNEEAYGRPMVEPLVFDTTTKESRSAWMEVLLLGAAHRIGFKLCQHQGFIQFLKRKGWWDEYCEQEVSPSRWMETLDQCLDEEEFCDGEYRYWFSLFIRIYQFAKHLNTYVQLFETWNDAEDCKKCDLAAIKENSKLCGTGIDAPGLQYALGERTGLSFVYREMVRRGAIRNPLLHRFCFVPYPRVSEFGLCIRDSEAIFDKAVHELGREAATFGLAFDIAITSYIRSRG